MTEKRYTPEVLATPSGVHVHVLELTPVGGTAYRTDHGNLFDFEDHLVFRSDAEAKAAGRMRLHLIACKIKEYLQND